MRGPLVRKQHEILNVLCYASYMVRDMMTGEVSAAEGRANRDSVGVKAEQLFSV